ncbi:hypothetical protein AB838_07800 [Rhodobacteraceae bacterium (ex Bugula neritina AB1)]|nr:hypothetical protein AB838_07800 [Rhodobacteraceae bacterium (ex Bugula neritina AB1)]
MLAAAEGGTETAAAADRFLPPMAPGVAGAPAGSLTAQDCPDTGGLGQKVAPGTYKGAEFYYYCAGLNLGLDLTVGPSGPTLTELVQYLGYSGVSARDLEEATPAELMPQTTAEYELLAQAASAPDTFSNALNLEDFGDQNVLSVRYFSQKISNYHQKSAKNTVPGWRKLVRLAARPGSKAAQHRITAGYILYNYISQPPGPDLCDFSVDDIFPWRDGARDRDATCEGKEKRYAEAVQLILEVDAEDHLQSDRPSLYFLIFAGEKPDLYHDPFGIQPYGLSPVIRAGFDLAGTYPGEHDQLYFVPDACAQCHGMPRGGTVLNTNEVLAGEAAGRLKLNFLDTDHWYAARALPEFDQLNGHDVPVLIDADPSDTSGSYEGLFEVYRQFNAKIRQQVLAAAGNNPQSTPGLRALANWQARHADSSATLTLAERVPPLGAGQWDLSKEEDANLLVLLDHYCSRCHADMFFSIYEKPTVKEAAYTALFRLTADFEPDEQYKRMPQGREMPETDKQELLQYLEALAQ